MRDVATDRVSNQVFDVVRDAIWAGVSPEEFRVMVIESWKHALDDEAQRVATVFKR